jgi:17beta-estradiol 17-dehydrogenase / very-long-chain 3-oxoacyl-CoA reductase
VSHGFNVILQGHNKQELETAKAKLEGERLGAKIKVLVIDALTGSTRDLEKEIASVQHLNITILVNNVGGFPPGMGRNFKPLAEYNFDEIDGFINLNARFLARITRLVLPFLPRKSPSLIMNVSSGADIGMPWIVMYSGAKGFVTSFSKALAREMKTGGLPVEVVALRLGDVQSGSNTTPLSWKAPSSRVFARATLDRVGRAAGDIPHVLVPYWAHALTLGAFDYLPEQVKQSVLDDELRAKGKWFDKAE